MKLDILLLATVRPGMVRNPAKPGASNCSANSAITFWLGKATHVMDPFALPNSDLKLTFV